MGQGGYISKSNAKLQIEIKQLEQEYEAIRQRMLKDADLLDDIKVKYNEATTELNSRLYPKKK